MIIRCQILHDLQFASGYGEKITFRLIMEYGTASSGQFIQLIAFHDRDRSCLTLIIRIKLCRYPHHISFFLEHISHDRLIGETIGQYLRGRADDIIRASPESVSYLGTRHITSVEQNKIKMILR